MFIVFLILGFFLINLITIIVMQMKTVTLFINLDVTVPPFSIQKDMYPGPMVNI